MKRGLSLLLFVFFCISTILTNAQGWLIDGEIIQNEKIKFYSEKQQQEKRDWLVNTSDYVIEGGICDIVSGFAYNNDAYLIYQINVKHVLRGENVPDTIFFVRRAFGFLATGDEKYPFRINPKPQITPWHHSFHSWGGTFFLKKNTIPISLPDSSKMDTLGIYYPTIFNVNPNIQFNEKSDFIFQPVDETEWGIESYSVYPGKQFFGLYGKGFTYQEMYYFLHQYSILNLPVEESFIMDYEDVNSQEQNATDSLKKREPNDIPKKRNKPSDRYNKN